MSEVSDELLLNHSQSVIQGIESRINSLRGGGQPLPKSVRDLFGLWGTLNILLLSVVAR